MARAKLTWGIEVAESTLEGAVADAFKAGAPGGCPANRGQKAILGKTLGSC